MRKMIEAVIGFTDPEQEGGEKIPLRAVFDANNIVNIIECEVTTYDEDDNGTTKKVVKVNDISGDTQTIYDKTFDELKHLVFSSNNYMGRK